VKPFNEAADGDETRGNLNCTNVLLNSLVACFSPEIYLSQLAHRYVTLGLCVYMYCKEGMFGLIQSFFLYVF